MRDAAWQAYYLRRELRYRSVTARLEIKAAFAAGWAAANQEPTKLDTGSLFPTIGVDDAH